MTSSDLLKLFAQANRRCGHNEYANLLENSAAVYEASEILKESSSDGRDKQRNSQMPKQIFPKETL